MADLPIFADRMNDIEIAANAPITEAVNRKYGSNINYLLDFLGIADGSTSVAGTLSDFIQAVEEVSTHTLDLQATIVNNSTQSIGTYTKNKFVNQVFYIVRQGAPTQNEYVEHRPFGSTSALEVARFELFNSKDSGANSGFATGFKMNDTSGVAPRDIYISDQSQVSPARNDWNNVREFSKALHIGTFNFLNGPIQGDGSGFIDQAILPILELDYRDTGTSTELFITNSSFTQNYTILRGKKLNVGFNL